MVFNPDCIPSNPIKSSTSLASKLFYVMGESPKSKLKRLVYFKWKKLNTDGLSCGNPGLASAGMIKETLLVFRLGVSLGP